MMSTEPGLCTDMSIYRSTADMWGRCRLAELVGRGEVDVPQMMAGVAQLTSHLFEQEDFSHHIFVC